MTPFPSGSNPGLGLASKISRMFTLENSFTSAIHYKNCSQLATKHLGSIQYPIIFFVNKNTTGYLYRGPVLQTSCSYSYNPIHTPKARRNIKRMCGEVALKNLEMFRSDYEPI